MVFCFDDGYDGVDGIIQMIIPVDDNIIELSHPLEFLVGSGDAQLELFGVLGAAFL